MVHARTMSRHFQLIALALSMIAAAIAMTGCGEQSNNQTNGEIAMTPLSAPTQACAAGTTYQGNAWDQTPYSQFNITPYGVGISRYQPGQPYGTQGFAGCAAGTQAMCDAQYGLICVPVQVLGTHNVVFFGFGQNGFAYSGYGNVYQNGYAQPGYENNRQRQPRRFAHQVGLTCRVGVQTCGHRSFCRPLAPQSAIGVCAR